MQGNKRSLMAVAVAVLVVSLLAFAGCKGQTGSMGSTIGTISGVVTTATGTLPLAGVSVTASSATVTATTDANGAYSMVLPAGSYTITFELTNYTTGTAAANVAVGLTTTLNVSMAEAKTGAPTVTVTASGQNVGYGANFTVTANATDPDGDTISYVWTGATGTDTTATGTTDSLTKALGGTAAPSSDPGAYITAFTQRTRLEVLPINPDTRGAKSVTVKADDGKGQSTSASVSVYAAGIQPGINTVAVGVPVYLNSGSTSTTVTTTWSLTPAAGSALATTALAAGRNPMFVPDVAGQYVVTATTGTAVNSMTIYAGKWVGVISGGSYTTKVISGTTYTNYPQVASDPACLVCHDNVTAPNKFTPWQNTGHANFFATGIEGITSNSGTCTPCHLVGYDASAEAANDGFDDMAAAEGFTYAKSKGAWVNMVTNYPLTARRANIQCENCHGPQDSGASGSHTSTNSLPTSTNAIYRISYSAEVCAQCHASGTGHHLYAEWAASMHGRKTSLSSKISGNCARCHVGQGAVIHIDQILTSSNAGTVPTPDYTAASAEPITCTVCHDPHSTANEFQLRVINDVPTTMGGFGVTGFGTGAICVICHNVRNGNQCATGVTTTFGCENGDISNNTFLHEDSDPYAMNLIDRPHDAAQAEMIAGRSAFFFDAGELPWLSKHASVKDVCAGCHMALNPQTHLSHGTSEPNSHRFAIQPADADKVCANCHSANVSAEGLKANVEALIAENGDAMELVLRNSIKSALSSTTTTTIYINGKALVFDTGSPGSTIQFIAEGRFYVGGTASSDRARINEITWDSAKNLPLFTLANLDGTSGNANQDGRVQVLRKAVWNTYLVEIDMSGGIHNPSFAMAILNRTKAALLAAPTAP